MQIEKGASLPGDLLDHAPCGYLVMNAKGRVLSVNRTLADWLGRSVSDIEDRPATAVFSRASQIVFETSLIPTLRLKREVESVRIDLLTRDGTKIPIMMSANCQGEGHSSVTHMVLLKATARREYERDLLKARAEAEAQLSHAKRQGQLREQFVAVLGHDLRNPVASMSSGIRLLTNELDADKKANLLRLMQGSVQRMTHLIDNVLDFARSRLGGGIELDFRSDELQDAIQQAVDELRYIYPTREVELTMAIRDPVKCDVWRIGQVVSNLLGNALTHGDPKQPIQIEASTAPGDGLTLSVCNQGAPIPETAMDTLFDPFVRASGDNYRKGLGLGLYIASEIAKAHGGSLVVETKDQTCFTFRVPTDGPAT